MSTRANIILKEEQSWKDENGKKHNHVEKLYFYRHSDGYPESVLPSLKPFMDWLKSGMIRDNVSQAGGWIILLGANEYNTELPKDDGRGMGWKVGAYEPTTGLHGDINYLYTIDLSKKTLDHKKVPFGYVETHDE